MKSPVLSPVTSPVTSPVPSPMTSPVPSPVPAPVPAPMQSHDIAHDVPSPMPWPMLCRCLCCAVALHVPSLVPSPVRCRRPCYSVAHAVPSPVPSPVLLPRVEPCRRPCCVVARAVACAVLSPVLCCRLCCAVAWAHRLCCGTACAGAQAAYQSVEQAAFEEKSSAGSSITSSGEICICLWSSQMPSNDCQAQNTRSTCVICASRANMTLGKRWSQWHLQPFTPCMHATRITIRHAKCFQTGLLPIYTAFERAAAASFRLGDWFYIMQWETKARQAKLLNAFKTRFPH